MLEKKERKDKRVKQAQSEHRDHLYFTNVINT